MSSFAEKLQRATPIVEILRAMGEGYTSLDLGEYTSDVARIYCSPPKKAVLGVFYYLKSLGKVEKQSGGGVRVEYNNISIFCSGVLECKVVGYKKQPKTKEVEVVDEQTGEAETEEVPVYECLSPLAAASQGEPEE